MERLKIGIIGFGEAARAFASGWSRSKGMLVSTYDVKITGPSGADEIERACVGLDVQACREIEQATAGANVIFSLVTADQSLIAAKAAARRLGRDALYLDCNSCSPATKASASAEINAAKGRYVDVAVMSPVHPLRHQTPLLVSGPHIEAAIHVLKQLGMRPERAGDEVGQASSIKMLRSVIVKGMEALTAESLLAARRAGVEDLVIASLQASDPGIDWAARSAYNLERMMVHGARRAAEMREVAATVRYLGLAPRLSLAIADWQDEIAALNAPPGEDSLASRADTVLEHMACNADGTSASC